ncbi:retrovirus-related Pol polyprotein from transposon 17.6 [Trichonephila inaurata madagascariensis]|uniref:Retrovirus-related Pol polyprotein from transposon 17.6 n=1 Tax=Trichonephila inaurata madagascariensis TaxID=2747483 RepID=A0A8X7CDR3_9ARAC|nr:retrovirus-related Pol polyprotein from transposon 17.6 [Trichonephila inaurata madagascariensis]
MLNHPFHLYTDASATIVGAYLAHNDENGIEHPIEFYNKKLTKCQKKLCTIERKAYAVLSAIKKFDCWIFGSQIQAVSDHPLTFLTKGLPHGTKLDRWALALQRYDLRIIYRKGKNHGNADTLSSFPLNY